MAPHLNSQLRFFLAQLCMCLFVWVIEVWLSSVVAFLQRLNDLRCSSVYSDNHGNHRYDIWNFVSVSHRIG